MEQINKISNIKNISRNEVIKNLLKMIMDNEANHFSFNRSIRYQDSASKEKWRKFHLLLKIDEYEYFIDLRKFFKMSVSAIVAYAANKYFKKIIKSKTTTDNYWFQSYILIEETINDVKTWKIFWGFPLKIEEILFNKKPNRL